MRLGGTVLLMMLTCCADPPLPAAPRAETNGGSALPIEPLDGVVGVADPGHAPQVGAGAAHELVSEAPEQRAQYNGKLALAFRRSSFGPGRRDVSFGIVADGPKQGAPASIRKMRVTGFDPRVSVGFEHSFRSTSSLTGLADLGGIAFEASLWLMLPPLAWDRANAPKAPQIFSLDVTPGEVGAGQLRVVVPEGTPPGHYAGALEVEGNFEKRSFPLEIDVVRYEDLVDALLAKVDAPESELPVSRLLARPTPEKVFDSKTGKWTLHTGPAHAEVRLGDVADGHAQTRGAWRRWLVAGNGIWDAGMLEWLGPITDAATTPDDRPHVIAGPKESPLLFVRRGRSVDIVSIRERRTVHRLSTADHAETKNPLRVSPDGTRVVVPCGDALCFFSGKGTDWQLRVLDRGGAYSWLETDPDVRHVFAGLERKGQTYPRVWDAVTRYDLETGEHATARVDPPCAAPMSFTWAYSPRHELVVGLVGDHESARSVMLVHTNDLSVTPVTLPTMVVYTLGIEEQTGDVFLQGSGETACREIVPATREVRACKQAPAPAPSILSGTGITYTVGPSGVSYAR